MVDKSSVTEPLSLLLDLDGPILEVSHRYFSAHRRALERIGDHGQPLDLATFWQAKRERRPHATLVANPTRSGEYLAAFKAVIEDEELLTLDELQPGSLQALERLSQRFDLQVLSMRTNIDGAVREVDHLGITAYASVSFVSHQSGSKVPAAKAWAASRRVYAVVGDTEADAEMARALAVPFLGVEDGIRTGDFLRSLGAQVVHPSLALLSMQICK